MSKPCPLVFSMSDIEAWKRCRKKFDLSTLRGLEPGGDKNEAMQKGTDFHKLMELAANPGFNRFAAYADGSVPPMVDVAVEYLKLHPLPADIIAAEEPFYTFVDYYDWSSDEAVEIFIRTTFDLIYRPAPKRVRGRDYKTFGKAPSLDMDLDFQGRTYDCVLAMRFPDEETDFEWEYVRSEVGRLLEKGTKYVEWPVEDRYLNVPMVVSDIERKTTWRELQQTVQDLVRSIEEERLYRIDLKVGPHSCSMCSYNVLCKTEYAHGELSSMDIELLAKQSDPGERATKSSILADPRVRWGAEQTLANNTTLDGVTGWPVDGARDMILKLYGKTGLEKVNA